MRSQIPNEHPSRADGGYALVTVLMLLALLGTLLLSYYTLTRIEQSTTKSTMDSFVGFYAAEAGLNVRANIVRQKFVGYSTPSGTSPDPNGPCEGSNVGSGDYVCKAFQFKDRTVHTYIEEAHSLAPITVPRGEDFLNLHGFENHYIVYSRAMSPAGFPEAMLEMHFKSRTLPLFQFAAFYNKDLEILPSADWLLDGPVHSNGDLYLGSTNTLDITRQVTAAGSLYRGRKDADTCLTGPVRVNDPGSLTEIPTCSTGRQSITQDDVESWNQMIDTEASIQSVPAREALEPAAGQPYWGRADLRIVLDLSGSPAISVKNADGTTNAGDTALLSGCGCAAYSATMHNHREGGLVSMLDVDVQGLLNCMHGTSLGAALDDTTDGGLVLYLGVDGPSASGVNRYGVRVRNGAELASTNAGAPSVVGLTVASEQAVYIEGDYNATNQIPASFLGDTINVLSNGWNDANSALTLASTLRTATTTTVQAAFLGGTDVTGGTEGSAGQDAGGYSGGLENFIRLHEDWSGVTLNYLGSFVSLYPPRHASGAWAYGDPYYTDPVRNWAFDYDLFEEPLLVPPLTPVFVYLQQELFVRHFEL